MEEQNTTFSVTSPKRKRHFVKRRKEDLKVFIVTTPIEEDEDDNETNWKKVAYQLIPSKSTPTKDHYVCHIEDLNDNNIDKVRVGVLVENNSNNAFSVQIILQKNVVADDDNNEIDTDKMGEIKIVIKPITSSSPNELSNEILNNVGVSILSNTNANKIKQNKLAIKPLSVNCETKTFTEEIIIIEDDNNSEQKENFTDNLISKKDFLHWGCKKLLEWVDTLYLEFGQSNVGAELMSKKIDGEAFLELDIIKAYLENIDALGIRLKLLKIVRYLRNKK
ncbi:hypothetical protein ABK040_000423 [Willaertia magna]